MDAVLESATAYRDYVEKYNEEPKQRVRSDDAARNKSAKLLSSWKKIAATIVIAEVRTEIERILGASILQNWEWQGAVVEEAAVAVVNPVEEAVAAPLTAARPQTTPQTAEKIENMVKTKCLVGCAFMCCTCATSTTAKPTKRKAGKPPSAKPGQLNNVTKGNDKRERPQANEDQALMTKRDRRRLKRAHLHCAKYSKVQA